MGRPRSPPSSPAVEQRRAYLRDYMRQRRINDPDLSRRNYRELVARDPEYHRRWKDENREKIRKQERARQSRKNAARRRRALADPEKYKEQNRRDAQNRMGRQRGYPPISKAAFDALRDSYSGLCAYCSSAATTFDHVVPLAAGGAHTLENLAPACRSCNSSKNDTPLIFWLGRISYRRLLRCVT